MKISLLCACLAIVTTQQASSSPVSIRGHWLSEQADASIEIAPCADSLCGAIVWLRSPEDARGNPARDRRNPDPALRARPLLGLTILEGLDPESSRDSEWSGGTIYDPSNGSTYSSRLRLLDDGSLAIRGYVGIALLGRTTRWTRVTAADVETWIQDPSTAPPLPPSARCDKR